MTGRVHDEPVAPREPHPLAMMQPVSRLRRREQHPHRAEHDLALQRRTRVGRAPRRRRAPRRGGRLQLVGVVLHDVGVVGDGRDLVGDDVERLRDGCGFVFEPPRFAFCERAMCTRALHGPRRERVMRDDLRVRFAREAARTTEVVGVRVRDDHRVDVFDLVAGGLEPRLQRLPRLRTGKSGIDDGNALVVDEAVHVHVTEAGHPDRKLHPKHAGRDFADFLRGLFLLLARRARGSLFGVGHARRLLVGHGRKLGPRPVGLGEQSGSEHEFLLVTRGHDL